MKGKSKSSDRISLLPQDTIEKILTHMPIRDALRTSILSRKWKYFWRSIPKLVFDETLVESCDNDELDKYKFFNAIFHVLMLRTAPILEFSLFVDTYICKEIHPIILYLSTSNNIKKFIFANSGSNSYLLPRSLFSLQGLENLQLKYCELDIPLTNKGFSKLKCLHFYSVTVDNKTVFEFLSSCPVLEEFTWNYCDDDIYISECELVELLKCIPSVQVLEIYKMNTKLLAAGSMPHKLPISLPHLKTLVLQVCVFELSTVLSVISSSPNLEQIKITCLGRYGWCWCHYHISKCMLDPQDYSFLKSDHLKEMEIKNFHNDAVETEFVKLIMAKSPVLKKARIELSTSISDDDKDKLLRDLLHTPFPRASPAASFTIK